MRILALNFILLIFLVLAACAKEQNTPVAASPPEVEVATPLLHSITEWDDFTGRFEAVESVDVRPRVTGYLVQKLFKDGQIVSKGDVLFVIDPRPFEYQMQRAEAQFSVAKNEYLRAEKLRKQQVNSQEDFERRLQDLKVAEASLNEAKLDLAFTQVQAPIDGKISDAFVDIGNLTRENETVLTRIVTVNPIHFEFEASQGELLKYQRLDRAGKRPSSDTSPNPIFIKLLDEDNFSHIGRMDFVDNIIDPSTGTIKGRALVENSDAIIYPGLFGRARLIGSGEYQAILLPEKAINTDQSRKFVYIVNDENKAIRNYVEPGALLDNGFVVIREGLKGNERVVINGVQHIRVPEQLVAPIDTTLQWTALESMPDVRTIPSLQDIEQSQSKAQRPSTESTSATTPE